PLEVVERGEGKRRFRRRIVVDERTASLPAGHDALVLHEIERLAHRADADSKLLRELRFVGKRRSGLPVPDDNPLHENIANLQIERPRREPSFQIRHSTTPKVRERDFARACSAYSETRKTQ